MSITEAKAHIVDRTRADPTRLFQPLAAQPIDDAWQKVATQVPADDGSKRALTDRAPRGKTAP